MSQALRPVLHRNVASWNKIFAIFLPEIVAKVTHLAVEVFVLSGPSVARIAESVKLSPNRLASEAITNWPISWAEYRLKIKKMF